MQVLMINGSPHEHGTTATALSEIAKELKVCGIDSKIITVGNKPVRGCLACGGCLTKGECVQQDAFVSEVIKEINESDGLIVGSPVYYASINGTLKCLLDRVFYAKKDFSLKPAAAVAVARRAGTTATLDIINKYFMISGMPVVSSSYWNMVFGKNGEDALKDEEGLATMRNLARNMAFLIKCIKSGICNGIEKPVAEKGIRTNFIK